jgi:hypothetical protein
VYKGQPLLGLTFSQAKELMMLLDPNTEDDGACLTSYTKGISLYYDDSSSIGDVVEAVTIFREGYYERFVPPLE